MTDSQFKKIEKDLQKTHHVFKKNKASGAKVKNLISFSRGLSPEQLIIFIAKFIIGVSGTIHKKKLINMIKESLDIDNADVLIEMLELNTDDKLKVKDLLL